MTTQTLAQGTRTSSLTLGTLADATYVTSSAIDLSAAIPIDVTFEVEFVPASAPGAGKQLVLFAQFSLDNTNFTSGPTSGTTTTDEQDLHRIGVAPASGTGTHRRMFSLAGLPVARYMKLVVKNELGVALTSGTVYRADITGTSA